MNPQTSSSSQQAVTMFLKPSFLITAQSSGMQVSVTAQLPQQRPNIRN